MSLKLLVCVSLLSMASRDAGAEKKPDLKYSQDGNDLVVRMEVIANNSPHVLWTGVIDGGATRAALRYYIVQNTDLFVRSQKRVTVEWRLPGRKMGETEVRVDKEFAPNTAELKALMPQLQKLIEAGEERRKR